MPVRLEVFLQFSFSNIVFMFLLRYTCSVLRSRTSRKAFKFLSKRLVLLLYGNQYRNLCFACSQNNVGYLWSMRSPGGGELSLSACPGVGNRPPRRTKLQISGGMVTGRIESCIMWKEKTRLNIPVVTLLNILASAARPPRAIHIRSNNCVKINTSFTQLHRIKALMPIRCFASSSRDALMLAFISMTLWR